MYTRLYEVTVLQGVRRLVKYVYDISGSPITHKYPRAQMLFLAYAIAFAPVLHLLMHHAREYSATLADW